MLFRSVISVMGPRSRELLARISGDDWSDAAFGLGVTREVDLGLACGRAARMSYIGGPGFEMYVPVECAAGVYDALFEAGADVGLRDAGYYTIDALRIEAGRRAFAAELGPDETPIEAGLMAAVRLNKPAFIGRDALLKQQEAGVKKRLVTLSVDDPEAFPWGGEPILRDGKGVGEVTSSGYSAKYGRAIVMGYVRADQAIDRDYVLGGRYELDIAGDRFTARPLERPAYPYR